MISWQPMFEKLKEDGLPQFFLIKNGLDAHILQKLRHDNTVTTDTLNKICRILDCKPGDLLEYIPDDDEPGKDGDPLEK